MNEIFSSCKNTLILVTLSLSLMIFNENERQSISNRADVLFPALLNGLLLVEKKLSKEREKEREKE